MPSVFLQPLSEKEMGRLDDLLLKYASAKAINTLSELDGFFVALASSPEFIDPGDWLKEVGGKLPKPRREAEEEAFHALLLRYMNSVANDLFMSLDTFEPLFAEGSGSKRSVMVDDWCAGYIRGVHLAKWRPLPARLDQHLASISLHGLARNLASVERLDADAYESSLDEVETAMRELYRHALGQRVS